jgi:hypothetical protein
MLNEHQEQSASHGAVAIQANGNVIFNGLGLVEVRELCTLFLRDNFPRLREEARLIAEERVAQFASHLEAKLADNVNSIVIEKFRDPDVQTAINDAVQACARKGDAAHPNILANLILKKVSANSNDFKDIVMSEAVQVTPKLTREQIAFLAFVLVMQLYVFPGTSWESVERSFQSVEKVAASGFGISDIQRRHIHYSGAASVAGRNAVHPTYDMFDAMQQKYAPYGLHSFKSVMSEKTPTLVKLIGEYGKAQGDAVALTSVGVAIAVAYLSSFGFPDLDLLTETQA